MLKISPQRYEEGIYPPIREIELLLNRRERRGFGQIRERTEALFYKNRILFMNS